MKFVFVSCLTSLSRLNNCVGKKGYYHLGIMRNVTPKMFFVCLTDHFLFRFLVFVAMLRIQDESKLHSRISVMFCF